jgi:hypothetical protein
MYVLAIWTSSFKKALFSSFAHFFIGSLILWELRFFWAAYKFWLLSPVRWPIYFFYVNLNILSLYIKNMNGFCLPYNSFWLQSWLLLPFSWTLAIHVSPFMPLHETLSWGPP